MPGRWSQWARGPRLLLIAVLLVVCAAYANSFGNAFEFDDFHTVVDNPAVRSLRNVPSFFTDATTFSVLPANRTYRPIVSTSLALDYALGHGYVPLWFHLSTFLWFLLLIVLLFLLYRQMLDRTESNPANGYIALAAAAWFGLHPAMAETVNYVIQRGDLYCTLGCVATLVVWQRYPLARRMGLYLVPYALALLSKPPAAVFPVLLFFFVYFFEALEQRDRAKRALVAALPSLAITVALMMLQSAMTPKSFAPTQLSAWAYRGAQPYVWFRYFSELLLPVHLNVDSDLSVVQGLDSRALAGLLFFALLAVAIGYTARRRRLYPVAYGLIWFVVTQLPTSLYPLAEVENDHRMFFSFAGLMPAVVWPLWLGVRKVLPDCFRSPLQRSWRCSAVAAVAAVLLLAYGWGAHVRNAVWHTQETLWLDDVEKSPRNGRGLMIYGLTQMNKDAYPAALDYFTRALEFTPNYATLEINLGVLHGAMDHTADAERHFTRAIALAPNEDTGHAFFARWLLQQGRLHEAAVEAQQAVSLNPSREMQHNLLMDAYRQLGDSTRLHDAAVAALTAIPADATAQQMLQHPPERGAGEWMNLALEEYRLGHYSQAIEASQHALQLDPKAASAYNNIGASYGAMHQWDKAVGAEREALRLHPGLQIAQANLDAFLQKRTPGEAISQPSAAVIEWINRSLALHQAGQYPESIAAANEALKMDPNIPEGWNNIAAAEESMGHWDAAIAAAQKAISLRPDFQLAKNNLAWSESQKAQGK